jgi:hypothetical protein
MPVRLSGKEIIKALASGRAHDALDSAFRMARMCPESAPGTP